MHFAGVARDPFRITSFADPTHPTPIESYSYKNRGEGVGSLSLGQIHKCLFHSMTTNSNRIRIYEKCACNSCGISSFRTQDL
jgi:hypothetical protein